MGLETDWLQDLSGPENIGRLRLFWYLTMNSGLMSDIYHLEIVQNESGIIKLRRLIVSDLILVRT